MVVPWDRTKLAPEVFLGLLGERKDTLGSPGKVSRPHLQAPSRQGGGPVLCECCLERAGL